MKAINILSLVQAHESLGEDDLTRYLIHHGITIKSEELDDLTVLVEGLSQKEISQIIFDRYYVGYKIPQIGKEFDLLRIGNDCIINIELKSRSTEEKILKQLRRNKYYLSYIANTLYNFTFVSGTKKLYFLNDHNELEQSDFIDLLEVLGDQQTLELKNVDDLFNPTDYLVSPFNSTKKFLDNKYFLTNQQEKVKKQILDSFKDGKKPNFAAVTGSAGTGKTLLAYDLVKKLRNQNLESLVVHCGNLNRGHAELTKAGWKITPIKRIDNYDLSKYDIVLIDEAQRIYTKQLEKIIDDINLSNGNCVFSYDKVQTLSTWEAEKDIDGKINAINDLAAFKLSEKIRTNREIAMFIRTLFNNKRNIKFSNSGNVELNYFKSLDDAKLYLSLLEQSGWEVLRFTPSQYDNEHHEKYSNAFGKTSHEVIGQEFDCVAVALDQYFSYDKDGRLVYIGKAYYDPTKMLFQNITRTRKRINLIIIDNPVLLNRCIQVLQG
jgi:hypothetical protein